MTRSDGEGTGFISESKFIANPLGLRSLFLSAQPFPIYPLYRGRGRAACEPLAKNLRIINRSVGIQAWNATVQ